MDRICQRVDLSKAYLSLIENGQKGPPKDEIVVDIARVLGLDEDDLLLRAHRERYPEDVLELRRVITEIRQQVQEIRDCASRAATENEDGENAGFDAEKVRQSLQETIRELERLMPADEDQENGLASEIESLRAEEREFIMAMIREIKQLRPRRGPQMALQ